MVSRGANDVAVANGTGFTAAQAAAIPTRQHDIRLCGADAFFDTPVNKESGTAFTAYAGYYNYAMAPNYLRFVGASNPGYGADPRRGNAVPHTGTGNTGYVAAGYLLPKSLLGPKARVQPYASQLLAAYEALRKANGNHQNVNVTDLGTHFLLDNHNAKFMLNYRHRPDFPNANNVRYRPEITPQTQVTL